MESDEQLISEVKREFSEYLSKSKCRKTAERFAILEQIYCIQGHFNMSSLYESMKENNFQVSKATLYNTMDLLLDCGLVIKHQFGNNIAVYERKYGSENHFHMICTTCGQVWEIKDNKMLTLPASIKKSRKFTINYYSLYIYGTCSKCAYAKRKKLKRLEQKKQ